jgi:hypothetical protein
MADYNQVIKLNPKDAGADFDHAAKLGLQSTDVSGNSRLGLLAMASAFKLVPASIYML